MPVEIKMPQLGESVHEGTVGKWLKKVGEPVQKFEPLLEVITDKVDSEITATESGVLLEVRVPEGETVNVGTVLAVLGQPGDVPKSGNGQQPAATERENGTAGGDEEKETQRGGERITPLVARIAAEHDVDLGRVKGSGVGGRITREDVLQFVERRDARTAGPTTEGPPVRVDDEAGSPRPSQTGPGPVGGMERAGTGDGKPGFISPAVARLAGEHGVDLRQVKGTGSGGRITKQDVLAYVEQQEQRQAQAATGQVQAAFEEAPAEPAGAMAAAPAPAPAPAPVAATAPTVAPAAGAQAPAAGPGDQEIVLSPMRRAIAEHMVRSRQIAPHVTTVVEVDLGRVDALRAELGPEFQRREGFSLTYMPFIVHATTRALRAHPMVNAVWSEDRIILKGRINVGVAVAVDEGLLVPVVRDADEKTLLKLARDIRDLAVRAREKRLSPDEVQGATFTITNHGSSGSIFGTPIINQPNVAILGIGAVQKRVVVTKDDAIAIRPMCYVGLTFDHRVLDGAAGDRFLVDVKRNLEEFSNLA